MSKETIRQANEVVQDFCEDELVRIMEEVDKLNESAATVDGLMERLGEINKHISFVCGDNDELYQQYRYRAFLSGEQFVVIQGKEL